MPEAHRAGELPAGEPEIPDPRHQPAPAVSYDLWAVAGIVWRDRWLVLGITVLGASLVLAFTVLSALLPPERSPLPDIYRPSALLLINQAGGQDFASPLLSGTSGLSVLAGLTGVSGGTSYGELAITLLETKSTIDVIANEFDLASRYRITRNVHGKVRKAFKKKAAFDLDPATRTLRISYGDYDPTFAAAIVNRLVAILEQRFIAVGVDRSRRIRDLLAARHAEVEQRIVWDTERIKEFQQRYGVLDVELLAQEQVKLMAEVRTQFLLKEVAIRTYAEVAPRNDPGLLLLQAERENLRQLIEEMESGWAEYERMLPTQDELPDLALEYAQLRLELAVHTEIYKVLSPQYELEKLKVEGQEPIFQVLELADVLDLKAGPSRSLISAVALFVSLAIAILTALLRNSIRGRRDGAGTGARVGRQGTAHTDEEVEEAQGQQVMGHETEERDQDGPPHHRIPRQPSGRGPAQA